MIKMNVRKTPGPAIKARRVTLIDDEPMISSYYVEALKAAGLEVRYVSDFLQAEAIAKDQKDRSDLYIFDLMIPAPTLEMDSVSSHGLASGLYLVEKLRQHSCHKPVIILSNLTDPAIWNRLPLDANTRFAAKFDTPPFELVEMVKDCLQHAHN